MGPKPKPVKQDKPKRKRSRSERAILEDELDELVRQIVYRRDGGCVTPGGCGGKHAMTVSHYHKRGKMRLRWDLRNCNCQCSTHNGRHNDWPMYYENYMHKRWGSEVVAELAELATIDLWKWTVLELREMRDNLQAELERMKG